MLSHDRLLAEHAEIQRMAADLRRLAHNRPIDPLEVARARWAFSRVLLAHLATEDMLLYPMLRRGSCPDAAKVADRFACEVGGLADRFKDYMLLWSGDRIAGDPDGFERDTAALLADLSARIAGEEGELYRHIPGNRSAHMVDAGARAP